MFSENSIDYRGFVIFRIFAQFSVSFAQNCLNCWVKVIGLTIKDRAWLLNGLIQLL